MFSKDVAHYRHTPRTLNEAFGPYACFTPRAHRRTKLQIVGAALGVMVIGAWYGWMIFQGVS